MEKDYIEFSRERTPSANHLASTSVWPACSVVQHAWGVLKCTPEAC